MKTTQLILLGVLAVCGARAQAQLVLRARESFTHEFTTLPFQYYQTAFFPPYSEFGFSVIPDSVEPGTTLQYEMFANSFAEAPARSGVLTTMPPYDHAETPLFVWDDRQGAIRLTVLTGSLILGKVTTGVWAPRDNRTHNYYATTIVPPPRLLHRRLNPGRLQFSWTTNAAPYRLESSLDLSASSWLPVTASVSIQGGDYTVEVETTEGTQYFRLSKP